MDPVVLRNRYRVLQRLGAGGVGSVYAVEELRHGDESRPRLALKAVFADDPEQVLLSSLRAEFRVLAKLRHPAIARVYDFGRLLPASGLDGPDGRPGFFFTRDLIEGQDLEAYCRGRSITDICLVCHRTAEVLGVLHRAGMVHADFKPANVIVDLQGGPHLIDFGLVQGEGQRSIPAGTAHYLAPETLRGDLADRRADLYALGISIYQLVVGQVPNPGADLATIISWHLDGAPLRLASKADVPEELDEVVSRLTQRDPQRRYPSAEEAALALTAAAHAAGASLPAQRASFFVPPAPGETLTAPLAELEQAVHRRVLRGEGGPPLLALESDPGGGKSSLLQELAWRSQLMDLEVIRGEFRSGDPRAYGIWTDVLSQVAGAVGGAHPLEQLRPGEADRYAIHQQISDYLASAAKQSPLLILLDNAEQADPESRAALRFVARTLSSEDRIQLVAAYRSDGELHQALGAPARIRIAPLSLADMRRAVSEASGRHDEELVGRIAAYTDGNPLCLMEVLRLLSDAGWPANPDLDQLAPPRKLEDLCSTRRQALEPYEESVLRALAVLGRPASGRLLLEVLGTRTAGCFDQVGLPLERLQQLDWIDRNPDGTYFFRQGSTGRILYSQLDGADRRALHLAAALVLEQSAPVEPVERTRHALGAQRLDLALRHLDSAVAVLKSLGAHRSIIQIYEELAPLLEGDRARQRGILRELGELYRTVGDYDRATQVLQRSCLAADGPELASAHVALARVQTAAGAAEQALSQLEQTLLGELPLPLRLSALVAKTTALASLDAHEELLGVVRQALELEHEEAAAGRPDSVVRAELRGHMAWSLGHLQRYQEANTCFAAALTDARASDEARVEATILNRWAAVAMRQSDHARVPARYGEALDCARRSGDVERMATIRYNLSAYHLWRGEYGACLRHLEESLRLFEAMGAQQSAAAARCNLGLLELKLGLYERARADLEEAILEMRQLGRRSAEALALLLMALVQARRGKLDEARRGIGEARRIYLEVGQLRDAADALLDLAEVELSVDNLAAASRAMEQAASEVDLRQTLDLRVRASTLQARLQARSGSDSSRRSAAQALSEALASATELDSPELTWESHAASIELAQAQGQRARAAEHAVAAVSILERMAMDLPAEHRTAFWQDQRRQNARSLAALKPEIEDEGIMSPIDTNSDHPTERGAESLAVGSDHASISVDATLPCVETGPLASRPAVVRPALERGRAHAEERLYRLLEIYRQINSELNRERLLGLVMDTAVELTGAERGFLLLGTDPSELQVEVARNLDLDGETGSYSRSIAERVLSTGQPVITVSARNDPRFREYLSVHQLQLESVLCIPIHARGKTCGILYMESRFQTGRFTPEDQRLLMAFGDQVAIALTNARLHQDNLRKAQELERAKREIEALAEERGQLLNQRTRQLEEAQRDLAETRERLESRAGMFGMVGRSAPMLKLFSLMERIANADIPVLVEGESGTGKEMVARGIHNHSERRRARLVSVNCAAIPENLLESELFGHVRGAFTGADRDHKGLFSVANGGTLFLDEIGDMPARMQVDLLRALQEKTIRPVGGHDDLKVDVRVVAASNRPLASLVQRGTFREDLFYRLNVVTLRLPSLRERADDIPLLADHFLSVISAQMKGGKRRLTRAAMHRLMEYSWPGNVRQLEHALMNAAVLGDGDILDVEDFTLEAPLPRVDPAPLSVVSSGEDHRAREKQRILEALEDCNWNKSRAAEVMGMPRRTFYRRLKDYSIL